MIVVVRNFRIATFGLIALAMLVVNLISLRNQERMDKRLNDLETELGQAQDKLNQIKTRYEADSAARARIDSAGSLFPDWPN